MRDSQLEKMPLKELTTLQFVSAKPSPRSALRNASEVKAKMEELAQASGFTVAELLVGASGAKALLSTAIPRIHRRLGPAAAVAALDGQSWRRYRAVLDFLRTSVSRRCRLAGARWATT